MKKAVLLPALALALLSSAVFSFSPKHALANGVCLGGDGTGTLTWDNTTCPLVTATSVVLVYDITTGGWRSMNSLVDSTSRFNSRVNTYTNFSSWYNTNPSAPTPSLTDQYAYLYIQNWGTNGGSCSAASATYSTCSAVATEVYANVTTNGSVWDIHAGGGGGGGGGSGGCGLGCGGIPSAYTANFSSSTAQAAAVGAVGDLSSFAIGIILKVLGLLFALLVLAVGVRWIYNLGRQRGWAEGDAYAANEVKKFRDKYHL